MVTSFLFGIGLYGSVFVFLSFARSLLGFSAEQTGFSFAARSDIYHCINANSREIIEKEFRHSSLLLQDLYAFYFSDDYGKSNIVFWKYGLLFSTLLQRNRYWIVVFTTYYIGY